MSGALNERQAEYVGHIGASSEELKTIVDDILDLATLDAGVMELEIAEIPVRRAVEASAELARPRFAEHRISLEFDLKTAPASFHGDEQRVRQVLFNLLLNAANFAPEGSVVKVGAQPWREGVAISVHDDGPGMSGEVLDTLFQRFESRSNGGRRRGAGLGLSIVKSFVELHGGTVEIDTGAGRGTTVTVRFPSAPPDGLRAAAE
jgi:signal transduction histidine kinase